MSDGNPVRFILGTSARWESLPARISDLPYSGQFLTRWYQPRVLIDRSELDYYWSNEGETLVFDGDEVGSFFVRGGGPYAAYVWTTKPSHEG